MEILRSKSLRQFLLAIFPPLRKLMLHRYPYMYEPTQLMVLVTSLDEALSHCPGGAVVEVGCAAGHTTIFLSRHLYLRKYPGRYHAYDTFRGFTRDDQQSEIASGRIRSARQLDFSLNDRRWVQWAIDQNVRMVQTKLVEVDAANHDFSELNEPVAFVLLDVDVYRPTSNSRSRLWPKLAPGGLMVVDDCRIDQDGSPVTDTKFSGGHQALLDWAVTARVTPVYVADKLAIIRKPLSG